MAEPSTLEQWRPGNVYVTTLGCLTSADIPTHEECIDIFNQCKDVFIPDFTQKLVNILNNINPKYIPSVLNHDNLRYYTIRRQYPELKDVPAFAFTYHEEYDEYMIANTLLNKQIYRIQQHYDPEFTYKEQEYSYDIETNEIVRIIEAQTES